MKKLVPLGLLAMFLLCGSVALADEPTSATNANQEVDIDAAGAVALFLKQPRANQNVQNIKIRRSGFVFILSLEGKVPTTAKTESK